MVQPTYEQLVEALVQRDEMIAELRAVVAAQADRIAELERRLDGDSSTSSRPPSSDNPYCKGSVKKSPARASGRRTGRQPGSEGRRLRLVETPDDTVECPAGVCACGVDVAGLRGRVERRQVVERADPPPPVLTKYRVHHVACPGCGSLVSGRAPEHAGGRGAVRADGAGGSRGDHVRALCSDRARRPPAGHAHGSGRLDGFMAQVRGKAARLVKGLFLPTLSAT